MYTLYILYSENIDRFYVGYTNDFKEECLSITDKKKFTDKGIPWKIVYTENITQRKSSIKRTIH